MTEALYRTYRPQSFSEVLGQDHIVPVLEKALANKAISHAYLFAGSRGTGKTSIARIFAKELGTNERDIYEIDAASNRGIDDVRALRDEIQTLPFHSEYKVYIIDEVHMLTKEAFNALLKTLEEPPKHAIFILATTEPEKLPETVRSRCQQFNFKKPTERILADMVVMIAKKEGFILGADGAELIALVGDGSYRDTLGVLQKVVTASSEKTISLEQVEQITGAPQASLVDAVLASLANGTPEAGLSALESSVQTGTSMELFAKLLLTKLRAILLIRFAPNMHATLKESFGDTAFERLQVLADEKPPRIDSKTLLRFLEAYEQVPKAHLTHLPLELALLDETSRERI